MSYSGSGSKLIRRRAHKSSFRLLAAVLIGTFAMPMSGAQAAAVGEQARSAMEAAVKFVNTLASKTKPQEVSTQDFKGPSERATQVKHLRLCPRQLLLYVGEAFTLVPLPLDRNKEVVHGAALIWETKDPDLAGVSSWGEVSAIAPGHTQVTVQAGTSKAHVNVEVRPGVRPRLTDRRQGDLDWEGEHGHDCDDPESAQLIEPQPKLAADLSGQQRLLRPGRLLAMRTRSLEAMMGKQSRGNHSKGWLDLLPCLTGLLRRRGRRS